MAAWIEKVQQEFKDRQDYAEWRKSEDGVKDASFDDFLSTYKVGWRERIEQKKQARLAKEAKEREERLAKEAKERAERAARIAAEKRRAPIDRYWNRIACLNVTNVICRLGKDGRVWNPYRGNNQKDDYLADWCGPRQNLSKEDVEAGESILEAFGTKCMPNAYAHYEKCRDTAKEISEVFNETFGTSYGRLAKAYWNAVKTPPQGWTSFVKTLTAYSTARTRYFRAKDELIHYYTLWKLDAIDQEHLLLEDRQPLSVWLLEPLYGMNLCIPNAKELNAKELEFAAKYMPETHAVVGRMLTEYKEIARLLIEFWAEEKKFDGVRCEFAEIALLEKIRGLASLVSDSNTAIQELKLEYQTMLKQANEIAEKDHSMALNLQSLEKIAKTYVRKRMATPLISDDLWLNKIAKIDVLRPWHFRAMGFLGAFNGDGAFDDMKWVGYQEHIRWTEVDAPDLGYLIPDILKEMDVCRRVDAHGEGRDRYSSRSPGFSGSGYPLMYYDIPSDALFARNIVYFKDYDGRKELIEAARPDNYGYRRGKVRTSNFESIFCQCLKELTDGMRFVVKDSRKVGGWWAHGSGSLRDIFIFDVVYYEDQEEYWGKTRDEYMSSETIKIERASR